MESLFKIKQMDNAKDLPLPKYMTEGSAGMDLYANVDEDVTLKVGEIKLVKTGISIAMPNGYEAQIRPRSGLSYKYGITMVNSPGTIDADYRGEIGVILINVGSEDFIVKRGERIAQMVINEVKIVNFQLVDTLDETVRGDGGFGHTGK